MKNFFPFIILCLLTFIIGCDSQKDETIKPIQINVDQNLYDSLYVPIVEPLNTSNDTGLEEDDQKKAN
ncbi:hypothetical protein [Flammeovirga sp. EKP202]|uniref:hypothetical protein n=1 Tax=Flammeovirga sp. EKP202 TaxID=2770592 RepID=UPI00165FFA9D|nr:hypothetical protein [Flammeovirga sp. EKP202]MBD0402559.1 hypothetical protein [Flammeovirga sp. EKP202]